MQLIHQDRKKRKIENKEEIVFSSFSSYHLIALTARAKGKQQLGQSVTDDEDLTIQIGNKTFPKLNSNRLIDSPAAISGGNLHNLIKTVYFLTFLRGKNHKLILVTDKPSATATFESLDVYVIDPTDRLTLEPKVQAEDGDRRSWLTFVLDNLPLQETDITVTYSRRKGDSDDVKVKIDGKIQNNIARNIKHFLWRFVGSFISLPPTKTETQTFSANLSLGIHYVELDADRMPTLEKIIFNFGKTQSIPEDLPTIDNPKWTGDLYDDTETMLLARAIYGEAGGEYKEAKIAVAWTIRNRVEDGKNRWGETYHDIILADYQYEPFNDPNSDSFKKITQSQLGDPLENRAWQESYRVAEAVLLDREHDPTNGANHFYVPSDQPKQAWVDEDKFTVQVGATRFYKL